MNNEKYCKFVSSRGIAYNCNIYPKEIISDTKMFDINQVYLMFIDPLDLVINSVNKYLNSNKTIKIIFS